MSQLPTRMHCLCFLHVQCKSFATETVHSVLFRWSSTTEQDTLFQQAAKSPTVAQGHNALHLVCLASMGRCIKRPTSLQERLGICLRKNANAEPPNFARVVDILLARDADCNARDKEV